VKDRLPIVALLAVVACGAEVPVADTEQVPDSVARTMPAVPAAAPGRVSVVSQGREPEYRVVGEWPVTATRCDDLNTLQFFLFQPTFAAGVFIGLSDPRPGMYDVARADQGLPAPGTARVAVQMYPRDRSFTMPAVAGTLRIDSLNGTISGEFQVTLFELVFLDSIQMASRFTALPVQAETGDGCRVIGVPPPGADSAGGVVPG
jgi:hypothetical protein